VEVWDPKDKPTVFSQIKKLLDARTGLLRISRVCLYPGILLILAFLLFGLLTGCASIQWPWKKDNDAIIVTDLPPREFICTKIDCGDEDIDELVADEQNTIACIKLQPECKLDEEN
jgi:hypothetical protein